METDDKRCLCNKCADDYTSAGYVLTRTHGNDKEECEICSWYRSHEYIVIDKGRYDENSACRRKEW